MGNESIEHIFRNSNDPDELFDTFHSALGNGIKEVELFKILLGNPALSEDEICMYTEKLSTVLPGNAFDLFLWAARLFETQTYKSEVVEKSLQYYARAAQLKPENFIPYKSAINLYNYEIDFSLNKHVLKFIEDGILHVDKKSQLYKTLAEHYKKTGDQEAGKKYEALAEKAAANE